MQDLLGGSQSSGSSGSQQQGFGGLPPAIQQFFTQMAGAGSNLIPNATQMATPIGITPGMQGAINQINQGYVPSQAQVNSSMALQQNPYDQSVIDSIQRQANGADSLVKQAGSQAGQMNSNRTLLGANDVQNTADQTIGNFKNQEFQTAMNNALTTIPGLNMASNSAQLQAGQLQNQIGLQTSMAPITGLQSIAQILSAMPQNSGQGYASNTNQSSTTGGLLSGLGSLGSGLAAANTAFPNTMASIAAMF